MTETQISKEIGDFLTLNHIPNWRVQVLEGQFRKSPKHKWYHIKTGTKGLSDRQFMMNDGSGRTFYLEIKRPGKKQNKDQIDFEADCIKRGIPYGVACCIEDVKEILEAYNMLGVKF